MALKRASLQDSLREVVMREPARDTAGLLTQLASGTVDERRWAARDLADEPQAGAALGAHLLRESDASVREAIFTSLAAQATETAAGALLPLLRSEDASLRNGAIEALGGMPAAVAPRVGALLRDADPDVRVFMVNLLGVLRHPQVPQWLLQVLEHEPQVNVVAAAIEVLAEVGDASHADAVRRAARRFPDEPFIAFAADITLDRVTPMP